MGICGFPKMVGFPKMDDYNGSGGGKLPNAPQGLEYAPSRELKYPTKREKENHLRICHFWGYMLVPWRVFLNPYYSGWWFFPTHLKNMLVKLEVVFPQFSG